MIKFAQPRIKTTLPHWLLISACALMIASSSAYADVAQGHNAYQRKDYQEAFKQYRASAEQGDAEAQLYLAVMYRTGKGVQQSDEDALLWLRKSAELGNPYAQSDLGRMYQRG